MYKLSPADMSDEFTKMASKVQVAYIVDVLIGWFDRVRQVFDIKMKGHNGDSLMAVVPFVKEGMRARATWDWANRLVTGHRRVTKAGTAKVSDRLKLFMRWVDETPRPAMSADKDSPADWTFTSNVRSHAHARSAPTLTAGDSASSASGNVPPVPPDPPVPPGTPGMAPTQTPVDDSEQAEARESPPIPRHAPSTGQDMSAIAGVDLSELFFTELSMVTTVPTEYWARANTVVYNWVLNSEPGSAERDNALFWELLLHKMLLRRSSKSRGRDRISKDTLSARFEAFTQGDYQFLVQGLVKACSAGTHLHPERREHDSNARGEPPSNGALLQSLPPA